MSVIKEKNLYTFQTPSKHVISPHKPIVQAEDLSALKTFFDICLSSCQSEASPNPIMEYEDMLKSQMNLNSLRKLGADIVDWVVRILGWRETTMLKHLGDIPDVPFLNFVKFTMVDFLSDCLKSQSYNHNDTRSAYCEIFIPMFKAFGNVAKNLNYVWCDKKAKDSDYLRLVSNNFNLEKGNTKLLDG